MSESEKAVAVARRWTSRLERGAYIALIAVCCVAAYALIAQRFGPPGQRSVPQVRTGDQLDLAGQNWSSAPMTLVLAVNSRCHFCEDSLALYRKLCALRGSSQQRRYKVVAVSEEPSQSLAGFLRNRGVDVDLVLSVPMSRLHIRGTPTVLIADSAGVARSVFVGKLSEDREEALVRAVKRYCQGCAP